MGTVLNIVLGTVLVARPGAPLYQDRLAILPGKPRLFPRPRPLGPRRRGPRHPRPRNPRKPRRPSHRRRRRLDKDLRRLRNPVHR